MMTQEQIDRLTCCESILKADNEVLHIHSIDNAAGVIYAHVGHTLIERRILMQDLLDKRYKLLPVKPLTAKDFIYQVQDWFDKDNRRTVRHTVIMSKDGHVSCRVSNYERENVNVLSNVYVDRDYRDRGYCKALLDFVDAEFKDLQTLIYVDSYAPEYVRAMYTKRGYIIMNSGD